MNNNMWFKQAEHWSSGISLFSLTGSHGSNLSVCGERGDFSN